MTRARLGILVAVLLCGAACSDSSGTSGDAGAGTDAMAVGMGHLLACPTDVPSGACTSPGFTCEYSTQTCQCTNGAWTCSACPAAQPALADTCLTDSPDVPKACAYGAVTCTCDDTRQWTCGLCPAAPPPAGQPCGNTSFQCPYADQTCLCTNAGWSCLPSTCPQTSANMGENVCNGVYSCAYPDQDQVCSCSGAIYDIRTCSCPGALPMQGAPCAMPTFDCTYDEQTCSCVSGAWSCAAGCPTAQPAAGSACSASLTCTYDTALCYCMGGTWHC